MRITICGKIKYKEAVLELERVLTYNGHTVFIPIYGELPHPVTNEEMKELHRAHEEKIDLADEVWFIIPYGSDTAEEYEYAVNAGKKVVEVPLDNIKFANDIIYRHIIKSKGK